MKIKCIYCNSEENLTTSDIIPDSMTSAKIKTRNVCKIHNNLTNTKFENSFANFFSYFRNQLGFLDRRNGKEIKFKADIYANDILVLHNYSLSNLKYFFKTKVAYDNQGNFHLINVKPKYTKIINPNIHYIVNVNWVNLFLSDVAQKTIAKICYEFHCYNNHINHKEDRYNSIIDYIIGHNADNNPVEVIDDVIFDEITKKAFNYIEGAHGLFEYNENGKRYVVCSLFGAVWYRVTVCNDFDSKYDKNVMFLFLLDGSNAKHNNSNISIPCSINGKIGKIEKGVLFSINTIKIKDIKDRRSFLEPRKKAMDSLIFGTIITINQIKNYKNLLIKNNYESFNQRDLKMAIMFQEKIKITSLLCFYALHDLPVQKYTNREFLNYFINHYSHLMNNTENIIFSNDFISNVKKGIKNFELLERNNYI